MDEEANSPDRQTRMKFYMTTFCLAYRSFGVVYGDLITSPIYVYENTFGGKLRLHEEEDEIFGVFSVIFWTLTLVPLCKYIIFVLAADDNGEGGTFALYSLLCRCAKVSLLSADSSPGVELFGDNSGPSNNETKTSAFLRSIFDKNRSSRIVLLVVVLLGTSMVIGDGVLTPAMSVLSAVSGIKIKATGLHEGYILLIACTILVGLFALQHYGTDKVGFLFAPVLLAWLFCILVVGIYNVIHWNLGVLAALSPHYAYNFFKKTGKDGWSSLGGIVLCITGAEAMFADLGHFSKLSIRIAFIVVVYPCLIAAYMGEAAYLSKNKEDLHRSFYKAIPDPVFWPVFIIATLATIVGSQAIISGTFSIISQCRALKCFPRVKVKHTSNEIHGQIYIPEVNWILMVMCLALVLGFRDTDMIGNAYGLAVIIVMFATTCLMFLVIIIVWRRHVLTAVLFVTVFGSVELVYLSSCVMKVHKGGWLPVTLSLVLLSVMGIWHYGTLKKHGYEKQNKIKLETLFSLGQRLGISRVSGICLVYSSAPTGVPPMFTHFLTNFPAIHRFVIFVTFQQLAVPRVPAEFRYLISGIYPSNLRHFRCIVRYGYKDIRLDADAFENQVMDNMRVFLSTSDQEMAPIQQASSSVASSSIAASSSDGPDQEMDPIQQASSSAASSSMAASSSDGPDQEMAPIHQASTSCAASSSDGSDQEMAPIHQASTSCAASTSSSRLLEIIDAESVDAESVDVEAGCPGKKVRFASSSSSSASSPSRAVEVVGYMRMIPELQEAREESGVAYMMANTHVVANDASRFVKKFVINVVYRFLRQNSRRPATALGVPHRSLIEVGMVYTV